MFHLTPKLAAYFAVALLVAAVAATAGWLAYDNRPVEASLNLRDGRQEVPLDQRLTLTYSRPAGKDAVASAFHLSPALDGSLDRSADGRTFTFTPAGPWADLTVYTLKLDAFDQAGRRFPAAHWSFRTTIVPRIVSVTTDTGASLADGADLKLATPIKLTFNDAMDQASVKLAVNGKPADLAWQPGGTAALLQTKGIGIGPLQLELQPGAQDLQKRAVKAAWKLALNLVYKVDIHTVALSYPALVQVPNDAGAWDQSGLSAADMVFEYLTEGGITRLTAVFTSAPDSIGPVRSGRLISFGLTRHYHGRLFLSGLSDGSTARLNADPVPTAFDYAGSGYYRTGPHAAPDNLYIKGASVKADETAGGDASQLKKAPVTLAGEAAPTATVTQHGSVYTYDAETGTYLKQEDGHRYSDALIGQPLRIQMLVVMHTSATMTSYVEDVNGVHGLDFNLESGGKADFYYRGQHVSGSWSSPSRSSAFVFKTDAGATVNLPGGLVWIDVVTN